MYTSLFRSTFGIQAYWYYEKGKRTNGGSMNILDFSGKKKIFKNSKTFVEGLQMKSMWNKSFNSTADGQCLL